MTTHSLEPTALSSLPIASTRPIWTNSERLAAFLLAVAIFLSNASRFLAGSASLAFFDDDFFYYLQIARQLAQGHGSTFDGLHFTNGYHPLWMLALWSICLLPQVLWLPVVTALVSLSAWVCFVLGRRILLRTSWPPLYSTLTAGFLGLMTMFLTRGGMEITLTLPLLFWIVDLRLSGRLQLTGKTAILYGFLGALTILSRLDAILFFALLFTLELSSIMRTGLRRTFISASSLLLGLAPVAFYLLTNYHFFGTLTPVSGQAKQLEPHPAFSWHVFAYVFSYFPGAIRLIVLYPACLAVLIAFVTITVRGIHFLPPQTRPLLLSLIVFPLVHLAALASLSDWPLWQWYLYPWIAGMLGAFCILGKLVLPPTRPWHPLLGWKTPWIEIAGGILLATILAAYTAQRIRLALHQTGVTFTIYNTAIRLQNFSRNHPGTYAMGDRAGIPGYLLNQPLIQTEGLVMDRTFLAHISKKEDLERVLAAYHVHYYVASNLVRQEDGCYLAIEPAQAGNHSPTMKTHLCGPPVAEWMDEGQDTKIFDLGQESNERRAMP